MTLITYESVIEKLQGHRVLLIGGAGFIGHNFAMALREGGVETMVADNMVVNSLVDNAYEDRGDPTKRKLNIHFLMDRFDMMREAGVELRNVDARLYADLSLVFSEFKPTKVVHLSAISSAVEARKNPGLCFDLQLTTLRNVLELCRLTHHQVDNLMFLSSSTVYGDFETPTVDENTRPRPRGIYANAKYMGERLVRTYCFQHGLGVSIVRPSALYGERCVSRRVSQAFVENALAGKTLYLDGGGDGRLDFTYIEDLVEGMVRTLGLCGGESTSETFNLTYGNARTIADLANIVQEFIPDVKLEVRERSMDRPIRGTLSMERARTKLGFEPKWPLERGYRKYCEWYIGEWEKVVGRNG
jgi:nucleoside-diphosphate-sugar epimerase